MRSKSCFKDSWKSDIFFEESLMNKSAGLIFKDFYHHVERRFCLAGFDSADCSCSAPAQNRKMGLRNACLFPVVLHVHAESVQIFVHGFNIIEKKDGNLVDFEKKCAILVLYREFRLNIRNFRENKLKKEMRQNV